ncbi:MAG: hypothetical protein IV100_04400 [Myxococcales bacterium]|nr:hypothetical protein [Myxococcales bacterium]
MNAPESQVDPILRTPVSALTASLHDHGYVIAYRRDGFSDCLVSRGHERVLGHGVTDDDALRHALSQLLPSYLARAAFVRDAGGRPDAAEGTLVAVLAEVRESTAPLLQLSVAPGGERQRTVPDVVTSPAPAAPLHDRTVAPHAAKVPAVEPPLRYTPAIVSPPEVNPVVAVSEVRDLIKLIDDRQPELALMTPERQKLQILAWISHARAQQEGSNRHPKVVDTVTDLARRLGLLSKLWWPGNVAALKVDATPGEVMRELLGKSRPIAAARWVDVAEKAESRLAEVEARDEAQGLDDYGWADQRAMEPPPNEPLERIIELRRGIERHGGPIDKEPPLASDELKKPNPEVRAELIRLARLARWLRGHTTDFLIWGKVMGRIRWLAAITHDEALTRVVSADYTPTRNWATELGEDPDAKRLQARRKAVVKNRPLAETPPDDVRVWIKEALGVLEPSRLAGNLRDHHTAIVLAMTPDQLEERRLRKHFRRLLEEFGVFESDELGGLDPAQSFIGIPAVTLALETGESLDEPEVDDATRHQDLLARVRPLTVDRRAIFVSNREDPSLRDRLISAFGFSELEWCDGSPRRVQDVADRVTGGRYDIVLGATGFQSHSMDARIMRACRSANVRYVRVHRGRQLACMLAIAREYGITADSGAV